MDLTTFKKPDDKKQFQKWTAAQEELLAEWSEKATCFRWLHSRSEKAYRFRNYSYTIPVIILSTLTGTANFAMDSFVPEEHKQVAMACVGGVNIFAGILSTLQNFLRYAELMESHRACEVQWSKFGRNISVELALDPLRRKAADDFLKICRSEYDRLIEQSPPIDDSILKQFKVIFKDSDIRKPDICNGLEKCKIFTPSEADKKADAVAGAGLKLMDLRGKAKAWSPVDTSRPPMKYNPQFKAPENESKKELEGLLNMSKVSEFKAMKSNHSHDHTKSVEENINEIIKKSISNEADIETGTMMKHDDTKPIIEPIESVIETIESLEPVIEPIESVIESIESVIEPVIESIIESVIESVDEIKCSDDDESNQIRLQIEFLKNLKD